MISFPSRKKAKKDGAKRIVAPPTTASYYYDGNKRIPVVSILEYIA